ncbi:hypothetical protein JW707_03175 [Candidatus Woesearchaeota archaeon]|nr:hypothetical protein [Candidatus Woesearchaeota archaeon]
MLKKKKAQVWYLDFMVGLIIFTIMVVVYYQYSGNFSGEDESDWEEMMVDSNSISSSLMSAGLPSNWTEGNVTLLGITDGKYRINETKLWQFENMSYADAKNLFRTRFDFYFFLEDANGTKHHEAGLSPNSSKFLVATTRFVIYNSSINRAVIHLWKA